MTVSVPNATWTEVLGHVKDRHAVWFQNFDTTNGFYVAPIVDEPADPDEEFFIAPAPAATNPTTLVVQPSGRDTTTASKAWYAYQASGGPLNLNCGGW